MGGHAVQEEYPPASAHRRLLVGAYALAALAPAAGVYVQQIVGELPEAVDAAAWRAAWQTAADRHAVLRTAFHLDGAIAPRQGVRRRAEFPVAGHDWRGLPAEEQAGRFADFLRARAKRTGDGVCWIVNSAIASIGTSVAGTPTTPVWLRTESP